VRPPSNEFAEHLDGLRRLDKCLLGGRQAEKERLVALASAQDDPASSGAATSFGSPTVQRDATDEAAT